MTTKNKVMPAPDKSVPCNKRTHYELMPEPTSRLLGIIEAGCGQFNRQSLSALVAMADNQASQKEAAEILTQNINSIRGASKGVAAGQRVLVYSALLAAALGDWRCEGCDFPDSGEQLPEVK